MPCLKERDSEGLGRAGNMVMVKKAVGLLERLWMGRGLRNCGLYRCDVNKWGLSGFSLCLVLLGFIAEIM